MKSVCAAVFGLVMLSSPALADTPEGVWLSEDGGTKVHLANCGGKLCGTVVWLEKPIDARPASRRPTRKIPIRPSARVPCSACRWCTAWRPAARINGQAEIYNADDGKTYSAHMMPNGNTAKVQGCVLGFLCKTQNWKRAN